VCVNRNGGGRHWHALLNKPRSSRREVPVEAEEDSVGGRLPRCFSAPRSPRTLTAPAVAEVKLVGDTSPKTPGPTLPNLFVGITGSGSLDITAGSTLTVDKTTSFGLDTGSEGTGTITGAGSKLTSDVINLGLCGRVFSESLEERPCRRQRLRLERFEKAPAAEEMASSVSQASDRL
jgi:hypothetical protein